MELLDFLQPFEDECVYPFSSWQLVKKEKGETTTLDYLSTCINLRGNLSTAHTHRIKFLSGPWPLDSHLQIALCLIFNLTMTVYSCI